MSPKLRRPVGTLLIALLVFCQQLGFAHALTHLGNATSPNAPRPTRSDTQHPAEKACSTCLLHAQLSTSLPGAVATISVIHVADSPATFALRWFAPEFVAVFQSRAPPVSP